MLPLEILTLVAKFAEVHPVVQDLVNGLLAERLSVFAFGTLFGQLLDHLGGRTR